MKDRMTINEFIEFAESADAKRVFGVTFVKKTTGEIRKMACRRGVTKGVKGVMPVGHRKAEDRRCRVLTVFDMNKVEANGGDTKGAFRRINLDGLVSMSFKGTTFKWDKDRELLVRQ
jgi:hypothetical protein